MLSDSYGRTIILTQIDGMDVYEVDDPSDGTNFTLSFPSGTDISRVLNSINAMAPSYWVFAG